VTDRDERAAIVRNLTAIFEFEGARPSEFAIKQMQRWVAGEIDVEQMRDLVVAHASRPA
jgi:hypothetical protein